MLKIHIRFKTNMREHFSLLIKGFNMHMSNKQNVGFMYKLDSPNLELQMYFYKRNRQFIFFTGT